MIQTDSLSYDLIKRVAYWRDIMMKEALLDEARFLHESGKHDKAIEIYRDILKFDPDCEEALYRSAMILAESEDYQSAVQHLKHLLLINNSDPRILLSLANVYSFMHAFSDAYETLQIVIKQHPDYAPGFHNLGVYFYRSKQWQAAIDAFKAAIEKKADYVDAYYHLGLIYLGLQQFLQSQQYFQSVHHLDATHVGARFHLGCIYLKSHEIEPALALFQQLHEEHPFHFETLVNMSHCYLAINDMKKAYALLRKAIILSPDDTQVLFNLGVCSYYQREVDAAIYYYQAVLEKEYSNVQARYNLALLYLDQKQDQDAALHLQILTDITPDFEEAIYLLNALKGTGSIKAAPRKFLISLFDQYAAHYDIHMKELKCSVPTKIHELYKTHAGHACKKSIIVDLGVGTGAVGELLYSYASKLIGVDLSKEMLHKARIKNRYSELHQDDILHFLQHTLKNDFADCIVAADSLTYIGDLSSIVQAVAAKLTHSGLFIFNIEKLEQGDYSLQPSGRFSHAATYIESLLKHAFIILDDSLTELRYHNDVPQYGLIYVACKQ